MYFVTLRQLLRRRASGNNFLFFSAFSTALVLLLTIDISVNAVWGEIMWINARDQPGGVPVFIATELSNWYQAWGSSAAVGLVLLSDALLVRVALSSFPREIVTCSSADLPSFHHLRFQLLHHHLPDPRIPRRNWYDRTLN
jgi:hypothetical protein